MPSKRSAVVDVWRFLLAKTVVILQSNYIPWRGYFDLLRKADAFVLLDSVQYTRQDWRNRNLLKTPAGPRWITLPVKGRFGQAIDETTIADPRWTRSHIRTIEMNYSKAAAFAETAPWLFATMEQVASEPLLSTVNAHLLSSIAARLAITTPLHRCCDVLSRTELITMEPTQRLVALCKALGADRYLSGPSARAYLDEQLFHEAGIEVAWASYEGYRPYPQLWGAFEPRVSIIDLLLNVGTAAAEYIAPTSTIALLASPVSP
jgi:WbqC-like protein family